MSNELSKGKVSGAGAASLCCYPRCYCDSAFVRHPESRTPPSYCCYETLNLPPKSFSFAGDAGGLFRNTNEDIVDSRYNQCGNGHAIILIE